MRKRIVMTASLAATAALAVVIQAGGEDPDAVLLQDGQEGRRIRMHEASLDFKLPDASEGTQEHEPLYREFRMPDKPARAPMNLNSDPPMQGRLPDAPARRKRLSKDRQRKNWILPPTPKDLMEEDGEDEQILFKEDGGDLLSSTREIYERAYRSKRGDEEDTDAQAEEAERLDSRFSTDRNRSMGLLLPESGLVLGPALEPLDGGDLFGDQDADREEPGLLAGSAPEDDVYGGMDEDFFASTDGEDGSFDVPAFNLRGAASAEGPDGATDLAMTRSLFSEMTGEDGNRVTQPDASFSFPTTTDRARDDGGWSSVLPRTAETMSSFGGTSITSVDTGERFRMRSFGQDLGETTRSGVEDFATGSQAKEPARFSPVPLGGSLFPRSAGTGIGSVPNLGRGTTIGSGAPSYGLSGNRSGAPSGRSGRGAGYGNLGSAGATDGTISRGGVRATDQIPNPLGGSLFER